MKDTLTGFIVTLFFIAPLSAHANTNVELRALLIQQIQILQELITQLIAQQTDVVPEEPQEEEQEDLQIEDIEADTSKTKATISWKTSIPAESRVILELEDSDRVFESNDGQPTKYHEVTIPDLTIGTEYEYEITAQTKDDKDNLFSTFTTTKEYHAQIVETEDNCLVLLIKDSYGNLTPKENITIRGKYERHNRYLPRISERTNSDSEVEYCYLEAETFSVSADR